MLYLLTSKTLVSHYRKLRLQSVLNFYSKTFSSFSKLLLYIFTFLTNYNSSSHGKSFSTSGENRPKLGSQNYYITLVNELSARFFVQLCSALKSEACILFKNKNLQSEKYQYSNILFDCLYIIPNNIHGKFSTFTDDGYMKPFDHAV